MCWQRTQALPYFRDLERHCWMDSKVLKGYLISLAIIGRIVESIFDMRNVVWLLDKSKEQVNKREQQQHLNI